MKYIIPNSPEAKLHIKGDSGAMCGTKLTGSYEIAEDSGGRKVCKNCLDRLEGAGFGRTAVCRR